MKKFFTFVMCAVAAMAASAQEIRFSGAEGFYNPAMAIPEMAKMEHGFDADGNPTVTMASRNGAIYTIPTKDLKVETVDRSVPSALGKFANVNYIKEFNHIDELQLGDLMGIAADNDYSLEEYVYESYASLHRFNFYMDEIVAPYVEANIKMLCLKNRLKPEDIRFHTWDVVYVGLDNSGNKIPLSTRFLYPYDKKSHNLQLTNYYIDNHVTVFRTGAEPTGTFNFFSPAPVCSKGYFVIQPDLIGYGASLASSQLYIDSEVNGAGTAYAIVAAQQFVKWLRGKDFSFTMDPYASVINAGASQGATSALSTTHFIESKLDKTKYKITLEETRLCGGAYNMEVSMNKFCEADTLVYACKVPMLIQGVATAHHDMLRGANGEEFTIHDYFSPAANNHWVANGVDIGNIWQVLDRKQTLAGPIEAMLAAFFPCDFSQKASFHKMLAADLFIGEGKDKKLNWDCDKLKALKKYLDTNNFTDPNVWKPKSKVTMVATPIDDIVPIENSYLFRDNMSKYNSDISLTILDNVPKAVGVLAAYGPHMMCCFSWIVAEITGLPVSIINEILIEQMEDM